METCIRSQHAATRHYMLRATLLYECSGQLDGVVIVAPTSPAAAPCGERATLRDFSAVSSGLVLGNRRRHALHDLHGSGPERPADDRHVGKAATARNSRAGGTRRRQMGRHPPRRRRRAREFRDFEYRLGHHRRPDLGQRFRAAGAVGRRNITRLPGHHAGHLGPQGLIDELLEHRDHLSELVAAQTADLVAPGNRQTRQPAEKRVPAPTCPTSSHAAPRHPVLRQPRRPAADRRRRKDRRL